MIKETCLMQALGGLCRADQSNVKLLLHALAGGWAIIFCITYIIIWKLYNQREKHLMTGQCVWFIFVSSFSGLVLLQLINPTAEAWAEFGLVRFPIISIVMGYCIISAPIFVVTNLDRTDRLVFRLIFPMALSCLSALLAICTLLFLCLPLKALLRQLCILCLCSSTFVMGVVAILCMSKVRVSIGNYRLSLENKRDMRNEKSET